MILGLPEGIAEGIAVGIAVVAGANISTSLNASLLQWHVDFELWWVLWEKMRRALKILIMISLSTANCLLFSPYPAAQRAGSSLRSNC